MSAQIADSASTSSGMRFFPTSSAARARVRGSGSDGSPDGARIRRCANCRPDTPVCDSISGIAFCRISVENRKPGSSVMPRAPPRLPLSGTIVSSSGTTSSRNQSASFWNTSAMTASMAGAGCRLPRSIIDRYETDGAELDVDPQAARRQVVEREVGSVSGGSGSSCRGSARSASASFETCASFPRSEIHCVKFFV